MYHAVVRWGEAALAAGADREGKGEAATLAALVAAPMRHVRIGLIAAPTLHRVVRPAGLVPLERLLDVLTFQLAASSGGEQLLRPEEAAAPQFAPRAGTIVPGSHVFESAFDTNGVLYAIATDGGKEPWQNPHTSGRVAAAFSSVGSAGSGGPEKFVLRPGVAKADVSSCTNNAP